MRISTVCPTGTGSCRRNVMQEYQERIIKSLDHDRTMESNAMLMRKANGMLEVDTKYLVPANALMVWVFFWLGMYYFMIISSNAQQPINGEYDLSGWFCAALIIAVTIPLLIGVARYLNMRCVLALYIVWLALAAAGLTGVLGIADDVPVWAGIVLIMYAALGLFQTKRSSMAIDIIDSLKDKEGFPLFDLNIPYKALDQYVKMREEWKKHKAEVTAGTEQAPLPAVTVDSDDDIEHIVPDGDSEEWFEQSRISAEKKAAAEESDMGAISEDEIILPEDEDFYSMPDRYREL